MASTPPDGTARQLERAIQQAIPGLVASLGAWGVTGAHWLPGPDGRPVLWLATTTDAQRESLQQQAWLLAQVKILLIRHGAPHETLDTVPVMFDSEQAIRTLLEDV